MLLATLSPYVALGTMLPSVLSGRRLLGFRLVGATFRAGQRLSRNAAAGRVPGSDRTLVFGGLARSSACRLSSGSMRMNLLVGVSVSRRGFDRDPGLDQAS